MQEAPAAAVNVAFDSESVLYRQPELLRQSIEAVQAQTPGKIDLFTMGFAGDGSEKVFRNEVEYFDQLMAQRFDASTRTLSLINAPDTVDTVPLATLTNLRAALVGVAARMDTSEDVLVLFLTSHGSQDHRLFVGLDPLPLRQIRPQDLRAALDDAGVRWRVIVVSSCYSGGFVEALRDPDTLVITAARADRTSFGCGGGSRDHLVRQGFPGPGPEPDHRLRARLYAGQQASPRMGTGAGRDRLGAADGRWLGHTAKTRHVARDAGAGKASRILAAVGVPDASGFHFVQAVARLRLRFAKSGDAGPHLDAMASGAQVRGQGAAPQMSGG